MTIKFGHSPEDHRVFSKESISEQGEPEDTSALHAQIQSLQDQVAKLQARLRAESSEKQAVQIRGLTKQNEDLEAKLRWESSEKQALERKFQQQKIECDDLRVELKVAHEEIRTLESRLDEEAEELTVTKQELDEAITDNKTIRRESLRSEQQARATLDEAFRMSRRANDLQREAKEALKLPSADGQVDAREPDMRRTRTEPQDLKPIPEPSPMPPDLAQRSKRLPKIESVDWASEGNAGADEMESMWLAEHGKSASSSTSPKGLSPKTPRKASDFASEPVSGKFRERFQKVAGAATSSSSTARRRSAELYASNPFDAEALVNIVTGKVDPFESEQVRNPPERSGKARGFIM